MTILNNNAVALSLGELDKNISRASRSLRKLSSGMRLNGAGDSAAEYAISEKMRTMIRSLGQDIDNVSKGIDLVKEAENGINCIVDELRYMKEMAIDSANEHNSDEDRPIIQKEFASRMLEIDDIAGTTNYNGIPLLDGRWSLNRFEYKESKPQIISQNTVISDSKTSPTTSITVESMTTTQIMPKTTKTTTSTNVVLSDTPPTSTGVTTKPPVTTSNTVSDTTTSEPTITTKTDTITETEVTQDEKYTTEINKAQSQILWDRLFALLSKRDISMSFRKKYSSSG